MQNKHLFNIMKNCLYVGSFNPLTLAHEFITKDLLNDKIVDIIYFLPVNSNKNDLVSIDDRINMINLIKNKKIDVLNIYNYDKLGLFDYNILKKITKDYKINYLIIGSDLFYKFNTFIKYKNILKEYKLIIIKRDNNLDNYLNDNYLEYKNSFIIINKIYNGSSRLAKKNLNKNNKYLNKKILTYINEKKLYN